MTRNSDHETEDGSYLFVVSYEDDAERKRVEYLFNNWDDGEMTKPAGLVRVGTDVDHDALYERLVSKVPADQVESFQLQSVDPDVAKERHSVEESVDADADAVESFVEYMLSKKKAVLQSAARNEYEVYTKKGRATVTYRLDETGETTAVTVTVEGYPPAPSFLADFFETELADYAGSQR
jgi:hypothetical protein